MHQIIESEVDKDLVEGIGANVSVECIHQPKDKQTILQMVHQHQKTTSKGQMNIKSSTNVTWGKLRSKLTK